MSTPGSAASPVRNDPFVSGNFLVEIEGIAATSFSEVSGLDTSIEVVDYRSGDAKLYTEQKLPGLRKYSQHCLEARIHQGYFSVELVQRHRRRQSGAGVGEYQASRSGQ